MATLLVAGVFCFVSPVVDPVSQLNETRERLLIWLAGYVTLDTSDVKAALRTRSSTETDRQRVVNLQKICMCNFRQLWIHLSMFNL
jgi:hypothetical protein